MMKKLLLATMLAGSFGTMSVPATSAEIIVRTAPPPMRSEAAPPPRRGHVWVPGYWDWRNNRYTWVRGHWVRERRGYVYNQPTWRERDGRWVYSRGGWGRGDRDRDGVPNRYDRDRDGDGVPNRMDNRPNNPNRS
jgi:hypothetical protein